MKKDLKQSLTKFVKNYIQEKNILQEEFKGLEAFFSAIKISRNTDFMEMFSDHMTEAIVTSLFVFLDRNPDIMITSNENGIDSGQDIIVKQIEKAIEVAKTTFAFSVNVFQENLKQKKS